MKSEQKPRSCEQNNEVSFMALFMNEKDVNEITAKIKDQKQGMRVICEALEHLKH